MYVPSFHIRSESRFMLIRLQGSNVKAAIAILTVSSHPPPHDISCMYGIFSSSKRLEARHAQCIFQLENVTPSLTPCDCYPYCIIPECHAYGNPIRGSWEARHNFPSAFMFIDVFLPGWFQPDSGTETQGLSRW